MSAVLIEFPALGRFTREWFEEHPEQRQTLPAQCKGRNPLCLCRTAGLPLYVAQRAKYYLARVPNSGPQHAPYCAFYGSDPRECGLGSTLRAPLPKEAMGVAACPVSGYPQGRESLFCQVHCGSGGRTATTYATSCG